MNLEKGKKEVPVKLLIYGTEGIGKSTLASKSPTPLFIDVEDGSSQLDVMRSNPAPHTWDELLDQVRFVAAHPDICETLVIDTADAAENLCIDHILRRENKNSLGAMQYGTGYTMLADEFKNLLKLLNEVTARGINVIVISHSQLRKVEIPDEIGSYDKYELKLQKKSAPLLKEWCDCQLFCNYKTSVEKVGDTYKAYGGDRVMYTTHRTTWDAKNRYGLPDELPLEFEGIKDIFFVKKPKEIEEVLGGQDNSRYVRQESFNDFPAALILRSNAELNGLSEEDIIRGLESCKLVAKGYGLEESPKIENYDQGYIERKIIPRIEDFMSFCGELKKEAENEN